MRASAACAAIAAMLLALPAGSQVMLHLPDNREGWPWGLCVHQVVQQDGVATAALDDLNAPWVRIDANWNGIEIQQGQFDWTAMDRMIDAARAHGLLVYATLAYTPQWATDGTVRNGVPRVPEYYGDFVRATVTRYRDRVKHWGLWNEPEGAHFWAGTPQQFVDLVLRPGFEAVRAADPGALVLGPDSGSDEWLHDIFQAGGGAYLDVITVHVYACCDNTDNVDKVLLRLDCTGGWPWDNCRRKVIEQNGLSDKPVWLTEVGWKTLTPEWEQKQADYYVELLDAMRARPWWKKTIFYEFYDETPCNPAVDNCWGIVGNDWSRKPAFDAFKNYITAHQPRAEAGADLLAAPGATVTFDGSASADPDGQIVLYRWDFDRSDGVTAQAQGASVDHVYPSAGTFEATLVVTDNDGIEDADTVTVQVGDEPVRPLARAVRVASPPAIDGSLGEWDRGHEVALTAADYVQLTAPVGGDADLSARAYLAWDSTSLYFAVEVRDDVHRNDNVPVELWKGDGIQLALDLDHDRTIGAYDQDGDYEINLGLTLSGEQCYVFQHPGASPPACTLAVSRGATTTTYEAAVGGLWLQPPAEGQLVGFSFLVNDDDGAGREGWEEWTPGIGGGKDPSAFGDLELIAGPPPDDGGEPESDAGDAGIEDAGADPGEDAAVIPDEGEEPQSGEESPLADDGGAPQDGTAEDADTGDDHDTNGETGCGCSTKGGPAPTLWLLAGVIWFFRRTQRQEAVPE